MPQAAAGRGSAQSMTGYGRAAVRTGTGTVTVELRSTNHRYLEIDQRLPNGFASTQARIAELIRAHVRRGRVETSVAIRWERLDRRRVIFDEALLERYHHALLRLRGKFGLKGPVTLEHFLALPQAVAVADHEIPVDELWGGLQRATRLAVRELVQSRRREGRKLTADVRRQIETITRHLSAIKRRRPEALKQRQQQLRDRLRELLGPGSSSAQCEQVASLVRDADIHEEVVRLESHLAYMRQSLAGAQLVGKRLDFVAQELMREANTMGAKVDDSQAAQHVVEIKGCVEKIREQVQNLE